MSIENCVIFAIIERMTMYNRIKDLCEKKGLNGKEFGALLGLKKSPLTDWKNEKAKPTVEQVIAMCDIFATTAEYIIFGKECTELSKEENSIIMAYRKADPAIQQATKKLLDIPEITSQRVEGEELSSSRTG
nr:helix-turn-helix transcriptional regulator [uncultured Blautia sp.]